MQDEQREACHDYQRSPAVNRRLCFPFKLSLNFSQATGQEELGLLKDWTAPLFCKPASSPKHLLSRKAEEEANG